MLTVETWCEALESGKYEQEKGQLRIGDYGYCCLGVVCDLSDMGEWENNDYCVGPCAEEFSLPPPLVAALGLRSCFGSFKFDSLPSELQAEILAFVVKDEDGCYTEPDSLADLNDAGVPFPLIAKVIRSRPKGLFREDAA